MQRARSLVTTLFRGQNASQTRRILGIQTTASQAQQQRRYILPLEGQSLSHAPVSQQQFAAQFADLSQRVTALHTQTQRHFDDASKLHKEILQKQAAVDATLSSLAKSMETLDDHTTNWFCRKFVKATVFLFGASMVYYAQQQ